MILSAQSLTKHYGRSPEHAAVRRASLELHPGDFVSVVGRSGSGKSTLLAMLGALTRPSEGRVLIDSTDLWALSEAELAVFRSRHTGFIFQFPSLLANLTAVDNVAVPALLARTVVSREAYARACRLLGRVGLAGRAAAYPASLSGGEQRRVAIARALINRPGLLLADEPTSDLDEDTEADIIVLLEELQRSEGFGLVLVTHNLDLARRAPRRYEMRQGLLAPLAVAQGAVAAVPPRHFGPRDMGPEPAPAAGGPIRLGVGLWRGVQVTILGAAAFLIALLLADLAVAKYEEGRLRENGARLARLADLALSILQGEVQSVADLGDGHYELRVALRNIRDDPPIYVMSPDMRGYVQVGATWREIPLAPAEDTPTGVAKIDRKQVYRYRFDARVSGFTQLLPNYMHVRFSDTMLVSPSSAPNGDVLERKDNYYIYLKPFDVSDETILRRMKFTGKPPVWIPMPPH